MRVSTPFLAGITLATFAALASICACGGKPKQADDPSNEATHRPPTDDGTQSTKWEGASAPPPASETKPKGPGVTSVNEGATRRSDVYDKEATEIVVKRSARQVKENCGAAKDDTGKATGPWGKVTIQIQLGHNGHSKGLTIPAPYQGKAVGNCIEKAFTNLTFPPWGGADTEISCDLELLNPAATPEKK